MPVFVVIIIMSDISNGTIRNKIIYGYKRHQIFASHFLSAFVYCFVLMSVYAGFTALFSCLFLGAPELDAARRLTYLYFYILGLLSMAVIVAIATMLSLSTMSSPISMIVTIAICILLGFATTLLASFPMDKAEVFLRFIPYYVLAKAPSENITTAMFLEGLGGFAIFTALFYGLGTFLFIKRDLK